jgi:cytochrome P450
MEITDCEFIPILRLLPSRRKSMNLFRKCNDQILKFVTPFLTDHKKCHVKGDSSDFIHAYLDRMGDDEADDESLLYIVRDLLGTGTETTSTFMRWAFVYMANNPDIQKKVQEELDRVLLDGRLPSLRDKADLPYTEAVIQELQRLSAVAPQIIPHETLDDVTLSGFLIPKGTMVSYF